MPLRHLLTLRPLTSTASSALTYVPAVLLARALAFVRTLLVAWLLNYTWRNTPDIGDRLAQSHFGAYQTALEFVNLGVPLLLMGAGEYQFV